MNRLRVVGLALLVACGGDAPVSETPAGADILALADTLALADDIPEWFMTAWFPPFDGYDGTFTDEQVEELLVALDEALSDPEMAANDEGQADEIFYRLGTRWQTGRLSDGQTATVMARLDAVETDHPHLADLVGTQRFLVENLIPGRVAPNIVGKDTDGVEFALEDYRGRIVVVIFSGEWCGPCRAEYPYQRAMLDIYREEDVVLLGVNSDAALETAQQAKVREGLAYRTWWDGHSQPDAEYAATEGPIATAWNVTAWPQVYVLDSDGVIRHTDKVSGELIAAVDKLVWERADTQTSG